jgi:predicted dehydrogenase
MRANSGVRRIRLGIVGAGLIWTTSHKRVLEVLEDLFEVAAFAVRSERTRDRLREQYPDAIVVSDYHELLRFDEIDAVVVLTPLHLNAIVTMAALESNMHVLVEKPLATSLDDAQRIIDLEKESGRAVLVLEQYRYDDALTILADTLGDGRIGEVVAYEMVDHGMIDQGSHSAGGYGNTDWRINPRFPLGALFDRGIHAVSRLTRLFEKPDSVYALGTRLRDDFGDYDHVLMTLAHPAGVHGTFSFAGYLDDACNYFYIRGTSGTVRVGRDRLEVAGEDPGVVHLPQTDRSLRMWRSCAERLSGGTSPVYGALESRDDIATLIAVDESIREGRKVAVR